MLILLPVAAFVILVLLAQIQQNEGPSGPKGWEGSLLIAASWEAAVLTISLEVLSFVDGLGELPVAATWFLWILIGAGVLVWNRRAVATAVSSVLQKSPSAPARFFGPIAFPIGILLVIAWTSPPNNIDSLLYHMSRVVHWAQNASLRHYATAYGHQLWNPPWAELAILNARLLWGNDRLANLVQWTAMLGAMVGVSGLAREVGLNGRGRQLAIVIGLSTPMLLLQATSTQNDVVTSFWLLASAFLVLKLAENGSRVGWLEMTALGCSLGVGMLTKGTFYVLGAPVIILFLLSREWTNRPGRAAGQVAVVLGMIVLLNCGYWGRNLAMGGTPLGPVEWIQSVSSAGPDSVSVVDRLLLGPTLVLRAASLHFATPWGWANHAIEGASSVLTPDLNIKLPPLRLLWGWNHEDMAGSPVHLLLILFTGLWSAFRWSSLPRMARLLMLLSLGGFILLPPLAMSSASEYGTRLQLPLFLLSAPWVAAVIYYHAPRPLSHSLAIGMLLLCLPWVLFNATRPAIALSPAPGRWELPCTDTFGCTRVGSVFSTRDEDVLFAGIRQMQAGYTTVTAAVKDSGCTRIGLRLDSSDPEYPLWHLLRAPESGIQIETLYAAKGLEELVDGTYSPCAIICTICEGETLGGLPLYMKVPGASLFLATAYAPSR